MNLVLSVFIAVILIIAVLVGRVDRMKLITPEFFILITYCIGSAGRIIWINTTKNVTLKQTILLGVNSEQLILSLLIIMTFFVFFAVGRTWRPQSHGYSHVHYQESTDAAVVINFSRLRRLKNLGLFSIIISIVGLLLLIVLTSNGGEDILTFSKRRLIDANGQRQSFVWTRTMIRLSLYTSVTYWIEFKRYKNASIKVSRLCRIIFGINIMLIMLYSLLANSRNDLVDLVFSLFVVNILSFQKLNMLRYAVVIFLLVFVSGNLVNSRGLGKSIDTMSNVESIVANNNFLGVIKTGLIADYVREDKMIYGKTFASAFFFFVPRTIWKDKPAVNPGLYVMNEIVNRESNKMSIGGMPPGIIAESFLNFGWLGLVVVGVILGRISTIILTRLRMISVYGIHMKNTRNIFLLVFLLLHISFKIYGGSLVQTAAVLIEIYFFSYLLKKFVRL